MILEKFSEAILVPSSDASNVPAKAALEESKNYGKKLFKINI